MVSVLVNHVHIGIWPNEGLANTSIYLYVDKFKVITGNHIK